MIKQLTTVDMKKPPEGGFDESWWPGMESNQGRGRLILPLDYFQLRFNFLCETAQSLK